MPNDELNRVVRGYAGQADDRLRSELTRPDTNVSHVLRAVRTLAAVPLDLRGMEGIDEILAWEAAHDDAADLDINLDNPAPALPRLATLAAERARSGRRSEAIELLTRAVRLALVSLGEMHRDSATYINGLARLYYQAGDYETAGHGFERAIEIRTAVMGLRHTDTAISLTGLARVREAEGRYADAVQLHRGALEVFESTHGAGHPDTAVNLNDLGCALHAIGELAEAKTLFERALAIKLEFDGPSSRNAATAIGNLGSVLESQGSLEQANQKYEEALAIIAASPDADVATHRWALSNLASVGALMGESTRARDLCEKALSMQFGDSPEERLAEATLRNNLGMSKQMLGDVTAARAEYQSALGLLAPAFGQNHPLILAIRFNLARCAASDLLQGSTDAAAEWAAFQTALGARQPGAAPLGNTGIWSIPWEGLSFPVMLSLAI
jgi:tetratricopeptide (TPR) repeat protein